MCATRVCPVDGPDAAVETPEVDVVIEVLSSHGREALIARAAASLPAEEVLVEIKDLASRRRSFATRPSDPRARLVARSLPTLLRGSLLATVTYWRVPADNLEGVEAHREGGDFSHEYTVRLRVVAAGARESVAA